MKKGNNNGTSLGQLLTAKDAGNMKVIMEAQEIDIKLLQTNNGQVDGLPKNPRQIKDGRYELLKKSITDAPEMLKLRELLVYPIDGGKFVVIGGNMRLRACKELGYKTLPCKVLDVSTPP